MNLIILIAVIGIVGLFSNEAYAEVVDWKIIYVTSSDWKHSADWDGIDLTQFNSYISTFCTRDDVREALWLSNIAIYSFAQYEKLGQYMHDPDCISINEFTGKLKDYQRLHDLPIFVLDDELTRKQVDSTGSAGHYSPANRNIVTQAGWEQNFSAWVLSHEIAHFSLHYLGYSENIFADGVEQLEDLFRECKAKGDNYEINLASCQTLWSSAETSNGDFAIMSPQLIFEVIEERNLVVQSTIERERAEKIADIEEKLAEKLAEMKEKFEEERAHAQFLRDEVERKDRERQAIFDSNEKLRQEEIVKKKNLQKKQERIDAYNEKQERLRIYQEKFEQQLLEDERQKQLEEEKQKQKTVCGAGMILNNENKCVLNNWWTNLMTWLGFF